MRMRRAAVLALFLMFGCGDSDGEAALVVTPPDDSNSNGNGNGNDNAGNNRTPELSPIAATSVTEGSSLMLPVTPSDPDGDSLTVTVTYGGSELDPFTDASTPPSFDGSMGLLIWQPAVGDAGVYTVTVTVTDDGTPPMSSSETVTITVEPRPVNVAPVLGMIGSRTVVETATLSFTVAASDANNGDTLTFAATYAGSESDPFAATPPASFDPATGLFTWTPATGASGMYDVTFTVTDDGDPPESDSETVTLTVTEPVLTPCDYAVGNNGVLVIQAEDLPLSGSWSIGNNVSFSGFTGSGYIVWTGSSQNNRPGSGLIEIDLAIPEAGRYRLDWYNRIGMGTDTREHNDTWVQFPDSTDYYGADDTPDGETRRYPKPLCDDAAEMAQRSAIPGVIESTCPSGSTRDGWLKVYSTNANDWRWSARTSDNDAHDIFVEFAEPGVYTLELSARADFHLIDRIVLHREDVATNIARDLGLATTTCN